MWDFIKVYLPITVLVVAGFVFAWQFVDPAPPKTITIATGAPDGAYSDFAARYRDVLRGKGLEVRLRNTAGAGENLALLNDPASGVDVAFVQSGIGDPFGAPDLRSLASVFLEPLWVFVRAGETPRRLDELKGKRIAIGAPGSGTRVLAKTLLVSTGIDDENSTFLSIGGQEAAARLKAGEIDAAFFVTARISETVNGMLRDPGIRILDFDRADAFRRHFLYLKKLTVPEGLLALDDNIPPREIDLVAPTAALVARESIHPAIVDLLLGAASEVHRQGSLFSGAGAFPSSDYVDFPLNEDAQRYFKSGPTFLRRVLPFWAAILVERLLIMLVPLITVMIPLFKIGPPAYRWGVQRKIYRWYKELRGIEERVIRGEADTDPDHVAVELDRIQRQVGQLKVPLSYAEQLYHLRLHIDFVKQLLGTRRDEAAKAA